MLERGILLQDARRWVAYEEAEAERDKLAAELAERAAGLTLVAIGLALLALYFL